ncbi:MAG: hypothetical protein LBT59_16305 [Clostridiales bacterium]|jgi:hypothetical protein|nr:hypothetical protein [Clostridiales bacterium]
MSSTHTFISNDELSRLRREAKTGQGAKKFCAQAKAEAAKREQALTEKYNRNIEAMRNQIASIQSRQDEALRKASEQFRQQMDAKTEESRKEIERVRAESSAEIKRAKAERDAAVKRARDEYNASAKNASASALRQLDDKLTNSIEEAEARLNKQLSEASQSLAAGMKSLSEHVGDLETEYSARFNQLAQSQAKGEELARATIMELQGLIETCSILRPGKFEPQLLEDLANQLVVAQDNLDRGLHQASLAISQVRLADAARLLGRLTIRNTVFDESAKEAQSRLSELESRIALLGEEAEPVVTFLVDGTEESIAYDVEHWTNGQYSKLAEEAKQLAQALDLALTDASSDENVIADMEQQASDLISRLEELDKFGRDELLRSRNIVLTAESICTALLNQGWTCDSGEYVQEDDRLPFAMKLTDAVGNEVALLVVDADGKSSEIALEAFAPDGTEGSGEVKENVQNIIGDTGFALEKVETHDDCSNNETADDFIQNTVAASLERAAG